MSNKNPYRIRVCESLKSLTKWYRLLYSTLSLFCLHSLLQPPIPAISREIQYSSVVNWHSIFRMASNAHSRVRLRLPRLYRIPTKRPGRWRKLKKCNSPVFLFKLAGWWNTTLADYPPSPFTPSIYRNKVDVYIDAFAKVVNNLTSVIISLLFYSCLPLHRNLLGNVRMSKIRCPKQEAIQSDGSTAVPDWMSPGALFFQFNGRQVYLLFS